MRTREVCWPYATMNEHNEDEHKASKLCNCLFLGGCNCLGGVPDTGGVLKNISYLLWGGGILPDQGSSTWPGTHPLVKSEWKGQVQDWVTLCKLRL